MQDCLSVTPQLCLTAHRSWNTAEREQQTRVATEPARAAGGAVLAGAGRSGVGEQQKEHQAGGNCRRRRSAARTASGADLAGT
jgi:hypothetical protein